MKLTIERAALLRSLNHIQSVVERRNTIPILAHVLVEANDDGVSLTATDMDISIVESAVSSAATGGATTAPAHTLYDIVRKLPDGAQIELDAGGETDRLTLSAGRSRFTLATLPTADFPAMSAGGNALLSEWHLPACRGSRFRSCFARRRDGWPSSRPRRNADA
jgi:DNA polymerase-3 subunit beta